MISSRVWDFFGKKVPSRLDEPVVFEFWRTAGTDRPGPGSLSVPRVEWHGLAVFCDAWDWAAPCSLAVYECSG